MTRWRAGVSCALLVSSAVSMSSCVASVHRPAQRRADRTFVVPGTSVAQPIVRTCQQGQLVNVYQRSPNDVSAGPLTYPNAQLLRRPGTQRSFYGGGAPVEADGSTFYKLGTFVQAGSTVTVTLAKSALSYARIQLSGTVPTADAVTFVSCKAGSVTAWVGGYVLLRRDSACVPVEVMVSGEQHPRRLTLSFFNGNCS